MVSTITDGFNDDKVHNQNEIFTKISTAWGLKIYLSKLMGSDFWISTFDASGAAYWRRHRHTRPRQQHNGHIRKFP